VAEFVKGDIVVVPFPFSDLTQAKRRPALVIASLEGYDVILCQVTSKTVRDRYSITLEDSDFERGSLKQSSNIRPNRIFTADSHIILYRVGSLTAGKFAEVIEKTAAIIQGKI
jgi:mRNA interferase MazF